MSAQRSEPPRLLLEGEIDRLYRLADRVTLQHALYNRIEIEWMVDATRPCLTLKIYASVPDRRIPSRADGQDVPEIPTTTESRFDAFTLLEMKEDDAIALVKDRARMAIRDALLHELDEMLLCDGKRIHDPHPNAEGEGWLDGLLVIMRDESMQAKLREGYRRDRVKRIDERQRRRSR